MRGEGGLDAAVIELDALADAVGAAAEDDDFFLLGDADFVIDATVSTVLAQLFMVGQKLVVREMNS